MPRQRVSKKLRSLVAWHPPLEKSRVEIDDPVVGHMPLMQRTLANAIVAAAGRREHFHGEQQLANRETLSRNASPFSHRNNEDVGLRDELGFQLDI
jgi:hypothetical protein